MTGATSSSKECSVACPRPASNTVPSRVGSAASFSLMSGSTSSGASWPRDRIPDRLRSDTVLAPGVAFVTAERLRRANFDRRKYFPGAPDFLVEVLSPSDSYSHVEKKVAGWLAAGARLVVLADPAKELLFVHRSGQPVQILSREDTLDASDVVIGWRVSLADVFEAE